MLEIAHKDFKSASPADILLEKESKSWNVTIEILPDKLSIIHRVREQCVLKQFELKWEFATSILLANPKLIGEIYFKVFITTTRSTTFLIYKFSKYRLLI